MTAMRLTTLDSGLRVASHSMPGPADRRRRPVRRCRVARRAGSAERHRPSVRTYGVQGRRRPLGPRPQRGDRGGRRRSQCRHRARRHQLHRYDHGRASAAGRRADRRHDPHARISPRSTSSARRGRPPGAGGSPRHAERHGVRRFVVGGVRGPGARPLDPRRGSHASPPSPSPTSGTGATRIIAGRASPWSPPARSTMTQLVELAARPFRRSAARAQAPATNRRAFVGGTRHGRHSTEQAQLDPGLSRAERPRARLLCGAAVLRHRRQRRLVAPVPAGPRGPRARLFRELDPAPL